MLEDLAKQPHILWIPPLHPSLGRGMSEDVRRFLVGMDSSCSGFE
jgi:hypothetical protein